jgi:hypothetical protein
MENEPRTIDITPTWLSTVRICIMVLENGKEEGRVTARAELERIGKYLDQEHITETHTKD